MYLKEIKVNSKRFGNLLLTGVILIMLGCSGNAVSEQESESQSRQCQYDPDGR